MDIITWDKSALLRLLLLRSINLPSYMCLDVDNVPKWIARVNLSMHCSSKIKWSLLKTFNVQNWLYLLSMFSYQFDSINSALIIMSIEQIDRYSFSICSSDFFFFFSINIIRTKSKDSFSFVQRYLFSVLLFDRNELNDATTLHLVCALKKITLNLYMYM